FDRDAWDYSQQILVVPAIRRQIVECRICEYATQSGARGIHQRDRFVDRDGLALLAGLYSQVDSNLRADLDHNVLTIQPFKPREIDTDRVGAGDPRGSVILHRLIRDHASTV